MQADVSIWLAFGAGFLSFISPCCLPLYPSYISYITGVSVTQLQEKGQSFTMRKLTMLHTLFFIIGFSIIFFAMGYTASWIGDFFVANQRMIRMLGGVLIILMGIFLMGIFTPKFLMREKRLTIKNKPAGFLGSILVGIVFAAGWTPCNGPILAMVLSLAASYPTQGFVFIFAYILGFAIPFFVMAFFIGETKWILRHSSKIMKVGGGIMVLVGILLYTDKMTLITTSLVDLFGGFQGF
ncbi:cytochrome c biogenesis CcdA family protein [Numidum massiliense]|uniref:cytochrome c biogenesis CcdA family protein n=1 Tax=Numidum massiliense TaxID=1522315 RepID=UPI0006D54134|nr:cytochrome c biogenesis protein CcdA [Numidum massiliense]